MLGKMVCVTKMQSQKILVSSIKYTNTIIYRIHKSALKCKKKNLGNFKQLKNLLTKLMRLMRIKASLYMILSKSYFLYLLYFSANYYRMIRVPSDRPICSSMIWNTHYLYRVSQFPSSISSLWTLSPPPCSFTCVCHTNQCE